MPFNLNIPSFIVLILSVLNFISIIAILFIERRDPLVTSSWVLILTFLPIIGVILYIFVGSGFKVNGNKTLVAKLNHDKSFHKIVEVLSEENTNFILNYEDSNFNDPRMKDYFSLIKLNYLLGNDNYTQDNNIEIFTSAEDKYESMLKDIENAKHSINLLYFIFKADDIGKRFIEALTKKAEEGVEVRLIYDDLGSIVVNRFSFNSLKRAGGKVYRFFPLKPSTVLRANYRNHRKVVVIDGKIGYIGGINIGDEYMSLGKIKPWRDTHMKVTGSIVYSLQARFLMDWYYASQDKSVDTVDEIRPFFPSIPKDSKGEIGMQIISSGPDTKTNQIHNNFVKMFGMAKKSILIQTPYFIPDKTFIETLQIASSSGVEVKVIIPGIPDKKTVYQITKSYIEDLLDFNIKVYLYNGFIHSKMIVIDDEIATIGTCNMDMRSLNIHFEVNALIYDSKTALECSRIFYDDIKSSKLVINEEFSKRGLFNKFSERVLRLLAPLM